MHAIEASAVFTVGCVALRFDAFEQQTTMLAPIMPTMPWGDGAFKMLQKSIT